MIGLRKLLRLFVDDVALVFSILACVALAAILRRLRLPPDATALLLVATLLLAFATSVVRARRTRPAPPHEP